MLKLLKGYRTIIFNVIMAGFTAIGVENVSLDNLNTFVDSCAAVWATGAIILRGFTNTPIFQKYFGHKTVTAPVSLVSPVTPPAAVLNNNPPKV